MTTSITSRGRRLVATTLSAWLRPAGSAMACGACLLLGCLLLMPGAASAAPFFDDFSADSSADYTLVNSFGSGGAFNVGGGKLNLTPGNSNTLSVVLDDGTHFLMPGGTFSVDMPASPWTNANYGQFVIVSSTGVQPISSTGWRIRRDWRDEGLGGSVWLQDAISGSQTVSSDGDFGLANTPTGNLRLFIERHLNGVDFDFYYLDLDTVSATIQHLGDGTLPAALAGTPLYVGVQAWKGNVTSHVFEFDNFSITAVPEVSTKAMGLLGALSIALLMWRRRRLVDAG